MQTFLILLGSINKFWRDRASCPQFHSELCLLMELSLRAVVAANVYLQLVGASIMLFCISSWKYCLNCISKTLKFFCSSILQSASLIALVMKIYILKALKILNTGISSCESSHKWYKYFIQNAFKFTHC